MRESEVKPPETLNEAAKKIWRELQAEYSITDGGGLLLLDTAMEAWQQGQEAQAILAKEGLTIENETTGFKRLNPAAQALKEARASFFKAISMLNLDISADEREW